MSKQYKMANIISLYEKLIIKEITYEAGDDRVQAKCEVLVNGGAVEAQFIISHTDLNRIISKIVAMGYEFAIEKLESIHFEDGTEVIDYKFENVFGEKIVLENFEFFHQVKEIRA